MIVVGIVAAVRLYREGLVLILSDAPDIDVAFVVSDWETAATLAVHARPDVILVDVPLIEARTALRHIASSAPGARLVALSVTEEQNDLVGWAQAGVAGYVTRDNSAEDLIRVVRGVGEDEMPCSPRAAGFLLRHIASITVEPPLSAQLTAREIEILRLLEGGLSNKEIGANLFISVATVKNHVHNLLEKLQVPTRRDAVARSRQIGIERVAVP